MIGRSKATSYARGPRADRRVVLNGHSRQNTAAKYCNLLGSTVKIMEIVCNSSNIAVRETEKRTSTREERKVIPLSNFRLSRNVRVRERSP